MNDHVQLFSSTGYSLSFRIRHWLGEESRPTKIHKCPLHHVCQILMLVQISPWGLNLYSKLLTGNCPDACRHFQLSIFQRKGTFLLCISCTLPSLHLICLLQFQEESLNDSFIYSVLQTRNLEVIPKSAPFLPPTSSHSCLPVCLSCEY